MSLPFLKLTAALVTAGALLAACSKPEPAPVEAPPSLAGEVVTFANGQDPVGLRTVAVPGRTEQTLEVPARLVWNEERTTRVYPPYSGRVERLRARVGDTVQRGQPLADLASADIGAAQADRQKAEADLRLARSGAERARELAEAGVIAGKELQQAQAELARAEAEHARAGARLSQYGVSSRGVTQGLTLAAPLSGVVVERNGNPGGEVRPDVQGAPLFTISDPTVLWALLDVDEARLAAFRRGQAVALKSTAWPDEGFAATVTDIGAAVDTASRTVKVRAEVPNPAGKLKAEMFVTAAVTLQNAAPQVPADAVFQRGRQAYAFVKLAPGRFERRAVQLRSAGPQSWSVLDGLKAGDQVVVGGGLYLNQLLDNAK